MPYYKDLRQHLQVLQERGKLVRIVRQINKDTELHPLVRWQFRGLREEQRSAFLFENVVDSRGRTYDAQVLVGGLAGSEEIYAIGLMCSPEEVFDKWQGAMTHPINPQLVSDGPVKEVVHKGSGLSEHGGFDEIPVPLSTPGFDNAPYLTAACWITKDPDTGIRNMGVYRAQIKGPLKSGLFFGSVNNCAVHWQKCNARGVPLEAAAVLGGPPCIPYAAIQRAPYGVDELTIAGGLAGEPVELVKCETVDLEVPAAAEIVIEGRVTTDYMEPEGSFGESHGFCDPRSLSPIFEVTCITHRRNPIYVSIMSQLTPSESSKTKASAYRIEALRHLRNSCDLKGVLNVSLWEPLLNRQYVVLQMRKIDRMEAWKALYAALGAPSIYRTGVKVIVAVDEDVDPDDPMSVNWAIVSRAQPHRDMKIVEHRPIPWSPLRYVADGEVYDFEDSTLLVDATCKTGFPPVALPRKELMERSRKLWEELELPKLDPSPPWYGYSLGMWSKEAEEEAELALKGRYYETGEKLAQRGVRVPRGTKLEDVWKRFHKTEHAAEAQM